MMKTHDVQDTEIIPIVKYKAKQLTDAEKREIEKRSAAFTNKKSYQDLIKEEELKIRKLNEAEFERLEEAKLHRTDSQQERAKYWSKRVG